MARMVDSGGVRLAVFEDGDPARPILVLVHGYPDTHRIWDQVTSHLAADFRVVRYDVRGAGASEAPRGLRAYRLDRLAEDLFAVIDTISPAEPVHVVAHDWGSIQCWEAVTDARAVGRISGYTSISGPCLDHVGHWFRRRFARLSRSHVGQAAYQGRNSWYIYAFHVPLVAGLVWRGGLAKRWPRVLRRIEGVTAHPAPTLADDAVRGIRLYRANMLPRLLRPRRRFAQVPVQLITLARDRYVSAALADDLDAWAGQIRRDTVDAGHWSSLLAHDSEIARLVSDFAGQVSTDSISKSRILPG